MPWIHQTCKSVLGKVQVRMSGSALTVCIATENHWCGLLLMQQRYLKYSCVNMHDRAEFILLDDPDMGRLLLDTLALWPEAHSQRRRYKYVDQCHVVLPQSYSII